MTATSNPYRREEIYEILTKAHITQMDSLNGFKWRIDIVYHSLNDKITWLTANMEFLAENIKSIVHNQRRETPARISMPSTSTNDRWIPSTDDYFPQSIDISLEQHDSQRRKSPSIDTPTRISIIFLQEFAKHYNQSIDSINNLPTDEQQQALFRALKEEIKKIFRSGNQLEEESPQKQLDIFYCSINSNMDWISNSTFSMEIDQHGTSCVARC
ncbi:hypothetical protein Rs2_41022 [Raphanus sativus]|nr:hypothetical protein Rs2_41022 [Raphanus sativus]